MARTTQQIGLRSSLMLVSLLFGLLTSRAEDLEYELELGGGLGTGFYLGDVNSTPFAHLGGMGGVVARRIFNPRMALKGNLAVAHLSGSSDGYFIPSDPNSGTAAGGEAVNVKFKRNVIDLGAQFEMNFWGYGLGNSYKNHSRITPYVLAGMGFTLAPGGAETAFALNLPVGVGVKYKVRPRLNIGLEWTMRFTTSDALDAESKEMSQLIHPYGIKSVGLKNKDCYSFTMVFLTYDLCPKYRKCNND